MKNRVWSVTVTVMITLGLALIALRVMPSCERFAPSPSDPEAAGFHALATELRELRLSNERTQQALEGLTLALSLPASSPPRNSPAADTRVAADAQPVPTFVELIASLDAMRVTFERESARLRDDLRATREAGGVSLVEARRRNTVTLWPALLELERAWRSDPVQANRSQYFQSARDLLETYGPPTEIYRPKGGVLFYYRRHPEGATGPAWYFRLQDGIVIEFFVEDETPEVGEG